MAAAFELNNKHHLLLLVLPLSSLTNRYQYHRSPSLPLSRGSTSTSTSTRLNNYLSYKCSLRLRLRLSHVHCKSHNSIPFLRNSNSNSNTTSLLNLQHITRLEEPAHPDALFVFYLSCFVGNIKEKLWNFTWPCAIAMLHPTLMPVACVAFFSKLAIFVGGPLIGNLMDSFPRMHSYSFLNQVKTAAQVISGVMIIHALGAANFSVSSLQTQTWFFVLLLAMSADKLASLALGVSVERDWVVMLAGAKREIALAHANATLSRVDLLCETGGAWLFAILLSKYDHVTCIKIACGISVCTLPLLLVLNKAANHLSLGVLEQSPSRSSPQSCEKSHSFDWLLNPKKIG